MKEKLFDSISGGRVRYFRRAEDDYILNSLQKVNFNEYLYRLLKSEGYERVIFVEERGRNSKVFTYDKFSQLSFEHDKFFLNVDPKDSLKIKECYDKIPGNKVLNLGKNSKKESEKDSGTTKPEKAYGYREIAIELIGTDKLDDFFSNRIMTVLSSNNIKTAVVIEMQVFKAIFERSGDAKSLESAVRIAGTIREWTKKDTDLKNILIFAGTEVDFENVFKSRALSNLHYTTSKVIERENPTDAWIRMLKESGSFVSTGDIGTDEIANWLLRRKLNLGEDEGEKHLLKELPATKIYSLATKIKDHILENEKVFENFSFNKGDGIRVLNARLNNNPNFEKKLIDLADKLPETKVNKTENPDALSLRRVYEKNNSFKENPEEREAAGKEAISLLNELIGLGGVKKRIKTIFNKKKYSSKKDAKVIPGHYIFTGNPGTGKTEVARLVSKILFSMGVLSKGHVVEVSRSKLVAGYVGQTAIQTEKYCEKALGGVLFVDEAYTLFDKTESGFGTEALDTIMKFIEDHRDDITVIFAGYENRMNGLMEVNAGFKSRISEIIRFPDYSVDELIQILQLMAKKENLVLDNDFLYTSRKVFEKWLDSKNMAFGNARDVRKYLEDADGNKANRISKLEEAGEAVENEMFNHIIKDDIGSEYISIVDNKPKPRFRKLQKSTFEKLALPTEFKGYAESTITETQRRDLIRNSILFVKTDIGTGTAFLISPDGYAITCNHVIEGAENITARLRITGRVGGDDSEHKCKVINAKKDFDMALIKLEGANFPYLPIADENREILDGESFTLSGYPLSKDEQLTSYTGKISNKNDLIDSHEKPFRFIEGEAKKGNSGSPLVSTLDGKVIGVLFGSDINEHDEMNKMRPIKYFWQEFLK